MNPFEVLYDNENIWKTIDHRVDGWLFMSSMVPPFLIGAIAFAVVLYGPIYMKTRPPLNIGPLMGFFNIFIVVFNIYIACQLLIGSYRKQYNWVCHPNDPSVIDEEEMRIVKAIHLFFICKMMELFDTFFMIARKKSVGQNTFIFIHHAVMASGAWIIVRWIPSSGFTPAILNAAAHAVMYTYFGLIIISPKVAKSAIIKFAFSFFLVLQQILFIVYLLALIWTQCSFALPFAYAGFAFIAIIVTYYIVVFFLNCQLKAYSEGIVGHIIKLAKNQMGEAIKYD